MFRQNQRDLKWLFQIIARPIVILFLYVSCKIIKILSCGLFNPSVFFKLEPKGKELEAAFGKSIKKMELKVNKISSLNNDGVLRLLINFKDSESKICVIKRNYIDVSSLKKSIGSLCMIDFLSGNEFNFYRVFEKDRKREKRNFDVMKISKVFYQKRHFLMNTQLIIMEDLSNNGYKMIDNPATEESVSCVLKNLKNIQEKWMGKEKKLTKVLNDDGYIIATYSPCNPPKILNKRMSDKRIDHLIKTNYYDFEDKNGIKKIAKLLNLYSDNKEKVDSYLEKYSKLKTLSHNDFRPDNIFLKKDKMKSIDLAYVNYDYFTNDLIYFICWVLKDVGMKVIEKCLDDYCSSFKEYSKEYMKNAIKELSVRNLIHFKLMDLTGMIIMEEQMKDERFREDAKKLLHGLISYFTKFEIEEILVSIIKGKRK